MKLVVIFLVVLIYANAWALPLQLAWDQTDVTNVQGFKIYRVVKGQTNWGLIQTLTDPAARGFVDKTATVGVEYCYQLTAFHATAGESPPSNAACAMSAGVSVKSQKQVLISRRADTGSSIVAGLVNANDNDTVVLTDKTPLVSRRADDGSSIVPVLVNADEIVSINGAVK